VDARYRLAATIGLIGGVTLLAAIVLVFTWSGGSGTTERPSSGRLGDHVRVFDARHPQPSDRLINGGGPLRRLYELPEGRLLVDLTPEGRVRQVTVGRHRRAAETWQSEDGDWSLDRARQIARSWLPADATLLRVEPFFFRGQEAGVVEVYACPSLRTVFSPAEAERYGAIGSGERCSITYYQTVSAGVAFALVGLH
jgi:hypothetical protein